jgi:hypothetical protein
MKRLWKRLERWFWPLFLLSPLIVAGAICAYVLAGMVWYARYSGR